MDYTPGCLDSETSETNSEANIILPGSRYITRYQKRIAKELSDLEKPTISHHRTTKKPEPKDTKKSHTEALAHRKAAATGDAKKPIVKFQEAGKPGPSGTKEPPQRSRSSKAKRRVGAKGCSWFRLNVASKGRKLKRKRSRSKKVQKPITDEQLCTDEKFIKGVWFVQRLWPYCLEDSLDDVLRDKEPCVINELQKPHRTKLKNSVTFSNTSVMFIINNKHVYRIPVPTNLPPDDDSTEDFAQSDCTNPADVSALINKTRHRENDSVKRTKQRSFSLDVQGSNCSNNDERAAEVIPTKKRRSTLTPEDSVNDIAVLKSTRDSAGTPQKLSIVQKRRHSVTNDIIKPRQVLFRKDLNKNLKSPSVTRKESNQPDLSNVAIRKETPCVKKRISIRKSKTPSALQSPNFKSNPENTSPMWEGHSELNNGCAQGKKDKPDIKKRSTVCRGFGSSNFKSIWSPWDSYATCSRKTPDVEITRDQKLKTQSQGKGTSNDSLVLNKSKASPTPKRTELPNLAKNHQKMSDKMASINEYSEKEKCTRLRFYGNNPQRSSRTKKIINKQIETAPAQLNNKIRSKKQLKCPEEAIISKEQSPKRGVKNPNLMYSTRKGFSFRIMSNKSPNQKDQIMARDERCNRRFEPLMKMGEKKTKVNI